MRVAGPQHRLGAIAAVVLPALGAAHAVTFTVERGVVQVQDRKQGRGFGVPGVLPVPVTGRLSELGLGGSLSLGSAPIGGLRAELVLPGV